MMITFFILSELLLYTPQQAIDYVSHSAKKYTITNVKEIKQVATLSLYSQNATFPIEKKGLCTKKMFSDTFKFIRSEKKHGQLLEIIEDVPTQDKDNFELDEVSSLIKDINLSNLEYQIISHLIEGYTVSEILDQHNITYAKLNNILKSVKRKNSLAKYKFINSSFYTENVMKQNTKYK